MPPIVDPKNSRSYYSYVCWSPDNLLHDKSIFPLPLENPVQRGLPCLDLLAQLQATTLPAEGLPTEVSG